jgi:hypothetical protein
MPAGRADDMVPMPQATELRLPPLVLHPFSQPQDPERLLACSRASLMLGDLIPREGRSDEELRQAILDGRYTELRMLYHIGADLTRWVHQCVEVSRGCAPPGEHEIVFQSFAEVLTSSLPGVVEEKLRRWGVFDSARVFSRALGLKAVFCKLPGPEMLTDEFVGEYQGYADRLFRHHLSLASYCSLTGARLEFDVYTSAEYSAIIERGLHDS